MALGGAEAGQAIPAAFRTVDMEVLFALGGGLLMNDEARTGLAA